MGRRLRDGRRGLFDRHAAGGTHLGHRRGTSRPGLRDGHRHRRNRDRPGRLLHGTRHGGRVPRSIGALLRRRGRRVPSTQGASEPRPVRKPQCHQRSAILTPRPRVVPQPAHLSQSYDAASGHGCRAFRARPRQVPVPRQLRIDGWRRRSLHHARPRRARLREPKHHGADGAADPGRHTSTSVRQENRRRSERRATSGAAVVRRSPPGAPRAIRSAFGGGR